MTSPLPPSSAASPAKQLLLKDQLIAGLNDALRQSDNPQQLQQQFLRQSRDYRSWQLMRALPDEATASFESFRELAPGLSEGAARDRLLAILSSAYREAADNYGQ